MSVPCYGLANYEPDILSILYIQVPSRASLGQPFSRLSPCAFALVSGEGIERQGDDTPEKLAVIVSAAERVVLLLAAADVTLLALTVPPLNPPKLKGALPGLVEEHVLEDADACVIVAMDESVAAQRRILVVQRDWLASLVQCFMSVGAHQVQALPAQLCLQARAGEIAAAISESGDLTLHLSDHQGLGWLSSSPAPVDVVASLRAIAPHQAMALHVPAPSAPAYLALHATGVTIVPDDWQHWIRGSQKLSTDSDLMLGLPNNAEASKSNRRQWRWPLRFALAILGLNVFALNLQWWTLAHETRSLREGMNKSYRAAYPDETVVVDPVAQTRQKIALAEQSAGKLVDDSFIALAARFGAVWNGIPAAPALPPIETIEYQGGTLLVSLNKPLAADFDRSALRAAFSAANLDWTESGDGRWKIGRGR